MASGAAPHSLLWPLLVAAACAWNCCLLPARLAFPCRTPRSAPYWLAADGLCDLIYLCDLLLVQPRLPATRGGDVIKGTLKAGADAVAKLCSQHHSCEGSPALPPAQAQPVMDGDAVDGK